MTARLPEVKKPVFIVGPERSGTTLLYSLLSKAEEFYWFSRLDSILPSRPYTAQAGRRLLKVFEKKPYIARYGTISSIRGVNTPSECNRYWKRFFGYYRVGDDRFTEYDLYEEKKQFIKRDLGQRLALSGKQRVLVKQPGFSLKLRFWDRIFPDALYLICIRNIEDNLSSLVKAKEASGEKFWGTKVKGWYNHIDDHYRSQALVQLKKVYSVMAEDVKRTGTEDRVMIVSHDRLLSAPEQQLKNIIHFCGVKWNGRIREALREVIRPHSCTSVHATDDESLPAHTVLKNMAERVQEVKNEK